MRPRNGELLTLALRSGLRDFFFPQRGQIGIQTRPRCVSRPSPHGSKRVFISETGRSTRNGPELKSAVRALKVLLLTNWTALWKAPEMASWLQKWRILGSKGFHFQNGPQHLWDRTIVSLFPGPPHGEGVGSNRTPVTYRGHLRLWIK